MWLRKQRMGDGETVGEEPQGEGRGRGSLPGKRMQGPGSPTAQET
jgi:hypothetical protein